MISSRWRANTRGTVPDHNFMYDIQQMESGYTRDSATKLWSGTVPRVSALRLLDIIHVTRQTDSKHTGQGLMMLDLVLPVQGLEARAFTHKGCINTVLLFKTLTLCLPDVMNNPSPLKNRPRCYTKSRTAQDAFRPIPGLISCAGVTGRLGLLFHACT